MGSLAAHVLQYLIANPQLVAEAVGQIPTLVTDLEQLIAQIKAQPPVK